MNLKNNGGRSFGVMRPGLLLVLTIRSGLHDQLEKSFFLTALSKRYNAKEVGYSGSALQAIQKDHQFFGKKNGEQLLQKAIANI
jgi:hypothetical protein